MVAMLSRQTLVLNRKVDGALLIPSDFTRRWHSGDAEVDILVNGTDPNQARIMLGYAQGPVAQWGEAQAGSGSLLSAVQHVPMRANLWMVYLGIGPTAVGFLCWAFVLSRWQAGRLGVTTYLVPPLVVLIGWLALSETPPWLAAPGGLLCLAGVAWSRRP